MTITGGAQPGQRSAVEVLVAAARSDVDAGPLCDTCIRREPAYHGSCRGCGTVARLHHHGLCGRCAVSVLLDAALAGTDGAIRAEVIPIRDALAAGQPVTVLNWLHWASSKQLLAQLAAGTGPVSHDTLDQLQPVGQQLLLGRQPLTAPYLFDRLLLELVTNHPDPASLDHTGEHRWLFPGRLHGQALHPLTMGQRLKRLGIHSRIARNTALMDNAATMPAVVLSELLGLSITGAVRWTTLAGATGNVYAADITRRPLAPEAMARFSVDLPDPDEV